MVETALVAVLSLGWAFAADRTARRGPERDSGFFWAATLKWIAWILGPLLLLSTWAELWPRFWETGYHLFLDRAAPRKIGWSFPIALGLPVAVWFLTGFVLLWGRPGDRLPWPVGGVGFRGSRAWIALCAIPLIPILAFSVRDLGGGDSAFPAATWSTLLVFVVSMLFAARSQGRQPVSTSRRAAEDRMQALGDWPSLMTDKGVRLRELVVWTRPEPPPEPRSEVLARHFEAQGASKVAPELIDAVADILEPGDRRDENGPRRLVFAPDDCGQLEAVSVSAKTDG